jgi:putative molybdopterin biosynthesis protein
VDTRTELPRVRQQRGISAAQLAALAGVSRQTIYAIEGGEYIPNTTLALQLARLLEVRVEDLFRLEGEPPAPPKPITVELLGDGARKGQAVQLCQVGRRLIGVAAAPQPVLLFADGVVLGVSGPRGPQRADIQVFPNDDAESKRILVAGCDPGISLLAQPLAKAGGVEMIVAPGSSQRALEWLKEGLVHVAGTHLRDGSTGEYNLAVIAELFPKGAVKVVTFAIWEQGLVFAAGNPKNIRGVEDLARPAVHMINREKGAGSRDLLDRELERAGVAARSVKGYNRIAHGHLPAALAVSLGEADCCVATRSAAQAFGLGFLPLATERYDLVIRRAFVKLPAVEALLDGLNRAALRRRLELLAGYDTSHTGEVRVT